MASSDFKFECPHCKQHLQCAVEHAGRQIQCPSCDHLINIPNPPSTSSFPRVPRQSGKTWDTSVPRNRKSE
jgi:hypothetical protein